MNHLIELTRHAAAYAGDNDILAELTPENRLPQPHVIGGFSRPSSAVPAWPAGRAPATWPGGW